MITLKEYNKYTLYSSSDQQHVNVYDNELHRFIHHIRIDSLEYVVFKYMPWSAHLIEWAVNNKRQVVIGN